MPIRDFPFVPLGGILRPWLPVRIINPHTGLSFDTYGLIDTGADECCVPEYISSSIGHNMKNGTRKDIHGVGGLTNVYSHTTKIEIYNHQGARVYTIDETCIDCSMNCTVVLLGVKQFLDKFTLKIDYPAKILSLTFQ